MAIEIRILNGHVSCEITKKGGGYCLSVKEVVEDQSCFHVVRKVPGGAPVGGPCRVWLSLEHQNHHEESFSDPEEDSSLWKHEGQKYVNSSHDRAGIRSVCFPGLVSQAITSSR